MAEGSGRHLRNKIAASRISIDEDVALEERWAP